MSSIYLLKFSYNDDEKLKRLLNIMGDFVDGIVVVYSSAKTSAGLSIQLRDKKISVHKAIPLDYSDPLRMYALSKISSDYNYFRLLNF